MKEADYLELLYDRVCDLGGALGDEDDRKFYFRREARKWRPRINPRTVEDFIDTHDFS